VATQGAESAVYDCLVLNLGSSKQRQTTAQGVQFFEPTILLKYAGVHRQLGADEGGEVEMEDFRQNTRCTSQAVRDRCIVTVKGK